jgi:hypothetical protein
MCDEGVPRDEGPRESGAAPTPASEPEWLKAASLHATEGGGETMAKSLAPSFEERTLPL